MEVTLATYYGCLIIWNTFAYSTPTAGKLQCRLISLSTRVHREDLVVTKIFRYIFLPWTESVIIESTRAKCQSFSLFIHGFQDCRVAVTLVDSRICRQEIVIFLSFNVPNFCTFSFC